MTDRKYKWWALVLLAAAFFLQQGTRQIYGATLPSIQSHFGVSRTEIGIVGTVFTFAYGICVPFAGIASDLLCRKWMVVVGVGIFSVGLVGSGFATSVGGLLIAYGLLNGFGQTFYYPSSTSLLGQLHRDSRATAFSILQLGNYAGVVICSVSAGWLSGLDGEGWRWAFWLFGGIGVGWAVVLAFALRNTKPVAQTVEKASVLEAFKAICRKPSAICLIVGLGMMIYVDMGFKIWMPSFLRETFGTSPTQGALSAVLWHYLGAIPGIALGSRISDRLVARRPGVRMEVNIAGLALAVPFIVLMAQTHSFIACCLSMGAFGFFRGIYDSNLIASLFDVVRERYHASAAGIMLSLAFLFGAFSPVVLGWLGDTLSMRLALSSLGAFYFIGAAAILLARLCFLNGDLEDRRSL